MKILVVLLAYLISLPACDRTSTLSMTNGTGEVINVTLYANDRLFSNRDKFTYVEKNVFRIDTLRHNETIEINSMVIGEVENDIPFDSIAVYRHISRDSYMLTLDDIYPTHMESDLMGLIAIPYVILIPYQ